MNDQEMPAGYTPAGFILRPPNDFDAKPRAVLLGADGTVIPYVYPLEFRRDSVRNCRYLVETVALVVYPGQYWYIGYHVETQPNSCDVTDKQIHTCALAMSCPADVVRSIRDAILRRIYPPVEESPRYMWDKLPQQGRV